MLMLRFPSLPLAGFEMLNHFPYFTASRSSPQGRGGSGSFATQVPVLGGFSTMTGTKSIPSEFYHSKMMLNISCQVQLQTLPCPWLSQQSLACPKLCLAEI